MSRSKFKRRQYRPNPPGPKHRWQQAQPHLQRLFKEAQSARGFPLTGTDQRGIFDLIVVELQHIPLVFHAATIGGDNETHASNRSGGL
jgi:hypothetical protein